MHSIESNGTYCKILEAHGRYWKLEQPYGTQWKPLGTQSNPLSGQNSLFGTGGHTDTHTNTQTTPCIELRYAQQIKKDFEE